MVKDPVYVLILVLMEDTLRDAFLVEGTSGDFMS